MRGVEATTSGATEIRQRQSKIKAPELDVYILLIYGLPMKNLLSNRTTTI